VQPAPAPEPAKPPEPLKSGVGDATAVAHFPVPVAHPAAVPAPAAATGDAGDQKGSGSDRLLLLVLIVLGLVAANACFRFWRLRRQKQQYTVWRPTQESRWNAVLQRAEVERGGRAPGEGVERPGYRRPRDRQLRD
jgi:uncharacterized protein HemX